MITRMTTCVALLGLTGGSGKWTAFHLLTAPELPDGTPRFRIKALVRSPSKVEAWTDEEWIALDASGSNLKSNLELIKGSAKDPTAVKECLQGTSVLISTVGSVPKRQGLGFTLEDPHICEDVMKTVLSSLPHPAPRIIFISTTGLDQGMTDVPYLLKPLYRHLLHVPHADKQKAEQLLQQNIQVKEKIVVRAALLTDGKGRGWGDSSSHCIAQQGKCRGYTISRRDVGEFVATQAVQSANWVNKSVVISN